MTHSGKYAGLENFNFLQDSRFQTVSAQRSYCTNPVMLNLKEMPSSSLDWGWGDATACKQLGALGAGPDSLLGLSVQQPDSDCPSHLTEISQALTLPLCPFPHNFSEENNFQAFSVFLRVWRCFVLGQGSSCTLNTHFPGRISLPTKSGWRQVRNSRELHLGAGMEEKFHLTNWKLKYYNPPIYC